ncbi:unnamed protein product, partial [Mesorhabditis belari]|uniref:Carboxypeptidase n=1 Tax=Mesorhabditis belari TaxID=2138241 RepID=A0AAF3ETW0_9BILA
MAWSLVFLNLLGLTSAILVPNLPGQPPVTFKQYSGYYSVGESGNHQMHYWFTESKNNPSTDPVILWLTGGPGCSGISALFEELGPFQINSDGATLNLNPYSWNNNASLLIFESPVGVGYSYSKDQNLFTGDNRTASENWDALKAFFTEFSQYQKNDFYITGESYAGMYIPTLVQDILDRKQQYSFNLKGFAIGNGVLDKGLDTDTIIQFEHKHGMIDQLHWQRAQKECCTNGNTDDCLFHKHVLGWCGLFMEEAVGRQWESGINPYNMYADCQHSGTKRFKVDYRRRFGKEPNVLDAGTPCLDDSVTEKYMNRRDVRTALGIPGLLPNWSTCSDVISVVYEEQYSTVAPQIKNALTAGLKVMLYHGDIDMVCNFFQGQRFTTNLNLTQVSAKRSYHVNGQVGGFVTDWGQLKFLTVKGAGHMVPTDKPAVASYILNAFINDKKF